MNGKQKKLTKHKINNFLSLEFVLGFNAKCGNLWPYQHFSMTYLQKNAVNSVFFSSSCKKLCAYLQISSNYAHQKL